MTIPAQVSVPNVRLSSTQNCMAAWQRHCHPFQLPCATLILKTFDTAEKKTRLFDVTPATNVNGGRDHMKHEPSLVAGFDGHSINDYVYRTQVVVSNAPDEAITTDFDCTEIEVAVSVRCDLRDKAMSSFGKQGNAHLNGLVAKYGAACD